MERRRLLVFHRWITPVLSLVTAAVLVGAASSAWGQNVIKVEEDWELVIKQPDQATSGPQVTTTMSPFGNLNGTYFTLEINHKTAPSFTPGGLHIHQWSGESRQQTFSRPNLALMNTENEVVTWTQTLRTSLGYLHYEVTNGMSTTWGEFGYTGHFKLQTVWGVSNINSYSPSVSVAQSGVGFASNRVESLKLKAVRLYLSDGETLHDNTVRVVYQDQD